MIGSVSPTNLQGGGHDWQAISVVLHCQLRKLKGICQVVGGGDAT